MFRDKNRIIDWFTFLVNGLIAASLVLAGYFFKSFFPDPTDLIVGNFLIFSGLVLLGLYSYVLMTKTFKLYVFSVLITIICMVGWIIFEGSMDVAVFLPFYLIVFVPLSFYKYKLHRKSVDGVL